MLVCMMVMLGRFCMVWVCGSWWVGMVMWVVLLKWCVSCLYSVWLMKLLLLRMRIEMFMLKFLCYVLFCWVGVDFLVVGGGMLLLLGVWVLVGFMLLFSCLCSEVVGNLRIWV